MKKIIKKAEKIFTYYKSECKVLFKTELLSKQSTNLELSILLKPSLNKSRKKTSVIPQSN